MTTRKELIGWYSYSWASEPFIVSAVGTYVPILLEQFARDNAVWVKDYKTPCMEIPVENPGLVPVPGESSHKCVVDVLGWYIDTSSLALYTFSASVLLQTLVVISMSGAADRGKFRKKLLIGFAMVGALVTCLFLLVTPKHYYVAAILAILSNSAFGAVSVCGNAFLPVLVNDYYDEDYSSIPRDEQTSPLTDEAAATVTKSQLSSQISGSGVAIGYFAAMIVQITTMILIMKMTPSQTSAARSSTSGIQLAIFIVGIWWLVFQIPVALFLKPRPGPTMHHHHHNSRFAYLWLLQDYIVYGWKTLFATFKEAKQMKDVAIFLLGWFIVSDAATTINSAAVLFARAELQMSAPSLAVIGVLVVFSGMFGATIVPRLKGTKGNPVNSIVFVILIASAIPLYGIAGFFFKSLGLKHPWEMYLLAAWYGFALGGLNATCRSVFSLLIPRGKETTFFSLFSVTDKGSSVIGPAITGLITDRTHNIRYTFYFLLVMMLLSASIFYGLLDVERGRLEALYLEQVGEDNEDSDTNSRVDQPSY
jgi:UMF1 family MFS transporter